MGNKDELYLTILRDDYARNGVIPPFSSIAGLLNFKATSSVAALVKRLKVAGYLSSTKDKRLAPTPKFLERVIADSVRAGIPESSNDVEYGIGSIDTYLIEKPSHTVLLNVRGDSMVDAGLLDGDKVVVLKGAPSKVGDIVVAIVDNLFTVKYLDQDSKGYLLRPGNPMYKPIRPRERLEIFGLVTGSFRKN